MCFIPAAIEPPGTILSNESDNLLCDVIVSLFVQIVLDVTQNYSVCASLSQFSLSVSAECDMWYWSCTWSTDIRL